GSGRQKQGDWRLGPPLVSWGATGVGTKGGSYWIAEYGLSSTVPALVNATGGTMKTQGELEAAICEGISRFEQDYMGRGPKDIHTYLFGDLLVVRLEGVLTAAEQHLVTSLPAEKGRDLLKQVRTHLIEMARPIMEAMVEKVTGVKVLSLHHDISTLTGEEVVLFTLVERPDFREGKHK
ncbi:MAG: Na-translocating system protein MpsC family protein, partial [Thermoguttaceae bacterium]